MRIVIASDSYKGCLTSLEVANAIREGILEAFPECETTCVAVADGGEGTVEAIVENMRGKYVDVKVSGPLGNPVTARYGIVRNTAVMEMAQASGLALVPREQLNPMKASTVGTGQMIMHAIDNGCREFLIGIGGSATNDGGIGMLSALGYRFLDSKGMELSPIGGNMIHICDIDASDVSSLIKECKFTVACDVDTPFYGKSGAAYVFAPQKGATPEQVELLDKGLENLSNVIKRVTGKDISEMPGSGAAGGLGGAFSAFLNANLRPGIEMVLDSIDFDNIVKDADIVITGEGQIDSQTLRGKAPSGIYKYARRHNAKVFAFGGNVTPEAYDIGFEKVVRVSPESLPLSEAIKPEVARENLRIAASKTFSNYIK